MKRIVCTVLVLILCMTSAVSVYAAGPREPTIEGEMPDCYGIVGESEITLFTNAISPDGGTLEYQWYSTTVDNIATIRAIDDETGTTFDPPQTLGVVYYCYAVWNVRSGAKSQPVYSRLIRVEFYEKNPTTVEILSAPDKVVYTSGETLDLTGLKVRIWTSDGCIDSVNGDKLEITKDPLITPGEQKIKVAYGDAFDIFFVTVKEATHTHSFGGWMVTTNATCTESGIKTRECGCGQTERAEIPATGHRWDDGKVTKEPTEASDGEKTFTCTVCKATKTEKIKASEPTEETVSKTGMIKAGEIGSKPNKDKGSKTEIAKGGELLSKPTENTDPTENGENTISTGEIAVPDGEIAASDGNQPSGTEPSFAFPWWIIIVISAVLIISVAAVIVWVFIQKKKKTTEE